MSAEKRSSGGEADFRWLMGGFLIVLLLAAANYKLLFGEALPQWDAADFFGPQFTLVADHIKAHHLLMWDPWTSAGTPDLAEPELGVTSPLLLLIGFLAPQAQFGFVAYWMLIWIGGALGMFLLTRHLGAPLWGCMVATLGFATSGFYTGHAEHISSLYSVSALPFIIWRLDAALLQRRVWFAVQAGGLYGLSALGGYPQFTILTGLFIPLWAGGRLFWPERDGTAGKSSAPLKTSLASVALVLILGGLICSPIYLGFGTHTRGYSDRTGPRTRQEAVTSNIFPAVAFSTISSPYLTLLNMSPDPIWPETDVTMSSIYVGSGIMVLSLFALARRSPWRWWLAFVWLFFACCSVGHELPVRGWLYDLVIPTRYFRNASLFTAYVIFVLAILAAYAARDLNESVTKRDRAILLVIAVALASGAVASFKAVVHVAQKRLPEFRFANDHMLIVWVGFAILAFLFQRGFLSGRSLPQFVVVLAIFDAVSTIHISKPVLYTEATIPWWSVMDVNDGRMRLLDLQRQLHPPAAVGIYPNNRNIPLRVAVLQSYAPLSNRYYNAIAADPQISQAAIGSNRICFSAGPAWLKPNDADFSRFVTRWREFGMAILVLHTPDSMRTLSDKNEQAVPSSSEITRDAICSPATISGLSYFPNSLSFSYDANQAGWLLVTDRWAPGWNVTVNGHPQQNVASDFVFRAVHVDMGANRIEFMYRPRGFLPLAIMSWLTLGAIAGIEVYRFATRPEPIT
ncbi:MAG TPA: YfhO family protein [Bryobacteraceae bacterium]|jgi:hypothetical protein|nr:YfhO family protein [Bryobacteraceae bacterium]